MATLSLIHLTLTAILLNGGYGEYIDIRLVNGTQPNEGTIMYTEDCQTWRTWNTSRGDQLDRSKTDEICRHLGFGPTNWNFSKSPFEGPYGSTPSQHFECNGDEASVWNCTISDGCSSVTPGGVVCYGNNYLGCFNDSTCDRALNGEKNQSFNQLTINKCLDFCRHNGEMAYAGVELSHECYCSNNISTNYSRHGRVPDSNCHNVCNGSEHERCGGISRIAIFSITTVPRLTPNLSDSPCHVSLPGTESTVQLTTLLETSSMPGGTENSDAGQKTSSISDLSEAITGPGRSSPSTSSPPASGPDTISNGAIGGGAASAVVVVVVCIIIIILVRRSKAKENRDQKYGINPNEMNGRRVAYENSIVGFSDASKSDSLHRSMTDDQHGKTKKDVFTAQMKRETMIADYGNMEDSDNLGMMLEQEHRYENLADDATNKNNAISNDGRHSQGLDAMSTKKRPGPDGKEEEKDERMYAVPDKRPKSNAPTGSSKISPAVECTDDFGELYAMPEKNRNNKNVPAPLPSDDLESMYAMPNKPRFGLEDYGDTTEMIENDLYV